MDGMLENKTGLWKLKTKIWNLPNETEEGYIEDQASGSVLGLADPENAKKYKKGAAVVVEEKKIPITNGQKFSRSKPDNDGYFILKHVASERVLTAQTKTKITVTGKQTLSIQTFD